ncbi:restriction endonuclease subunit S [Psychrobacter sp. FME13]|uniref:restriction endonuclease subunit S n=1 Tax=Psychrobacter sp. FME13 TaxID=2487708 RepID=UPI0017886BA4|nr:restriction endonuclease subunit S [Psychrobacter sp. FME13]MBE0440513.1 restriction endonuclease subunit S [Psychrobacter sp. FME13]
MVSDWKTTTFEESSIEILDGDRGKNYPKKSEFTESGYCLFLNTGNVTKDGFKFSSTEFVSSERDQLLRKGKLQREDVVLTTRGTVGNVAYYDSSIPFDHIRINSGMVILRSDDTKILPRYLYLFLRSKLFEDQVIALQSGSAQPQLPIRDIKRVEIKVPSVTEQKTIAHILGTLDDKIELNRQMNETLEAMAQALFKSWFVDFDPVIDNALAAGNAIPDEFFERAEQRKSIEKKENQELQNLFPDEFEFTEEMGWIPKGWEVKPLDEVANYLNGLALQKYRPENIDDDYLPVVKIAQLREGLANHDEKASINIKPEYIIDNGDVIFSWSGSLLVDVWCGGKAALNQHLFKVTSGEYPKWFYLNYTKYHLAEFQRIATDKAVTMGHIKRGHLKEALCVIPENRVDDNVFAVFEDILNKQISSRIESQTIAKLRDTLLPKLMSGELRIPDAAALVDEAI